MRVEKFHFKPQKDQFIAARGGLRTLLADYLHQKPAEICFGYGEYGKPYIENTDLNFSLSHSGNHIVYAVTRGASIGVDIEEIKQDIDFLSVGKLVFSEAEYTQFLTVPEDERALAFYRGWTRKEAYIKAIGMGLHFPLSEVQNTFLPREWQLEEMMLNENTVLAIAVQSTGNHVLFKDFK